MPREKAAAWRADDLVNALSGMGDVARDKRLQTTYEADRVTQQQLEQWYRGSDLAATIVEAPVEEMFRQGFELPIEDEADVTGKRAAEDTLLALDELGFLDDLQQALNWARAYGGCGVLLGVDDGGKSLEQPLDFEAVQAFEWMTPLLPTQVKPVRHFDTLGERRYGEVEVYELVPDRLDNSLLRQEPVRVHESRILRFDGVRVARKQARQQEAKGWGDSVLVRCYSIIRDYTASWQGAASMLQHFSQAFLKLKGLAELLEDEGSTRALVARATGVQMSRSVANMVIMDSDEEMGVISTPLSGYPEMMQQFAVRLAAAARMPVTVLMGQSPAGLNATGESDVRNWYARVANMQEKTLRPALNRVLQLMFRAKAGPTGGVEPEGWLVRFRPLWQMTELEQADLEQKTAAKDDVYLRNGVVTPEEVAISRWGTGRFSPDTQIDVEGRRKMLEAAPPEDQLSAEAKAEAAAAAAGAAPEGEGGPVTDSRQDYDPNQPRDERGRFGDEGKKDDDAPPP